MVPPKGLRKEDEELDLKPVPWTQEEADALHEMVREYLWARRLRKKAGWIVGWTLGVPAAVLAVWEPMEKLFKLIRGH